MKTILITGANRGIGYETAKTLAAQGNRVYLGTRDESLNGQTVKEIGANAFWISIDTSRSESIKQAASFFKTREQSLNILINNAGIYPDGDFTITTITRSQFERTFATNTFGPVEVTQTFLPFIKGSESARIINVSSGFGQLDEISADVPSYCLSKLTLNGVTKMFAQKLSAQDIAVNSVCPGWVRTDMGGPDAARSIEEGAYSLLWLATEAPQSETGKFFRDGKEMDW